MKKHTKKAMMNTLTSQDIKLSFDLSDTTAIPFHIFKQVIFAPERKMTRAELFEKEFEQLWN